MKIVDCTEDRHGEVIRSLFNHVIESSTAMYDYAPRSREFMAEWFQVKRAGDYPVIGIEDAQGEFLGFATYGGFRPFAGYKYTVEHSVYVRQGHSGRGVGRILMEELVRRAEQQDYHVMIGCIDAENQGSIIFHEKLGFVFCGRIRECGYKFNDWRDVVFYQLFLNSKK